MKPKKTNAARRLDELGLEYELRQVQATEDDLSAETAADRLGLPRKLVYKTLVVRGDRTGIMEACLPAGRALDLKALAAVSGNKSAALVPARELPALTGYLRGGCSPLGGKKDYPVFILREITDHDRIIINAGARGLMLWLKPENLIRATGAALADFARSTDL